MLLVAIGTVCETNAWPWMGDAGSLGLSLNLTHLSTTEKFADGRVHSPAGRRVPVFNETPGTLVSQSAEAHAGFVVAKGWEIALAQPLARVHLDWDLPPQDEIGLGDTRFNLTHRPLSNFPATFTAGLILPTGRQSLLAFDASLGEGFWSPFAGVGTGIRPTSNLYLVGPQKVP